MAEELLRQEPEFKFDTRSQFLTAVRTKYPEYNTWNDNDLYAGWVQKYPDAEKVIRENAEPTSPIVTEAKKAPPPPQWYGRPLNTPVEQLEGGSDYIKFRQKQSECRQGFWESITPSAEDLPFVGAGLQAIDSGKVLKTANALGRGEDVDDQSLLDLNQFLLENDRRANATIVGKAGNIVLGSLTFGVELMGSIATLGGLGVEVGGMKAAMKAGQWAALKEIERLAYIAADKGVLMAVRHGVEKKVLNYVEKAGFKDLSKRMALKTADALVTSPIVGLANVVGAQGAQALITTVAGEGPETQMANVRGIYKALDNKAEPYWESAIMGALQQWIEGSSEVMGGLLMAPYFAAGRAVGRAMPAVGQAASVFRQKMQGISTLALQDGRQRIAELAATAPKKAGVASAVANFMEKYNVTGDAALKWLKKAGYNGVMGEFAEERYGGFLHGLFGTQGDEAGLANAFNQMIPTTADAAAEIMAFALPMQYVRGVNRLRGVLLGNKHGSIEHQFEDQQKAMTSENIVEAESARDKMGDYVVDMAEESLKNKNTHYSKTVNWLMDVAALPFTMSFSNTQYGNLDKLAFMEGAPAIVATLEGLQAKLMRDVDGQKPMGADEAMSVAKEHLKAIILDAYRRTVGVEPGSNEEKVLKAAEAAGVLKRTKRAVYAEVKEGETLDPETALALGQHNIPVVKMSVADVEKGVGIKGVEYTVEEAQTILSIKDRASALKLLARFNLVGEQTHQIPINAVGADVLDALEKKILSPLRKVVEHQKKGSLATLGSRYVKADGAGEHIVTGLTTDVADAQVTLKDAVTNAITHVSLADLNDESKWTRAEHNIVLTGAYSIVDTWDNIAKHLNEHDYTGVVPMPLLDAKGEQRKNDKKEELWQFTLGARMDKATGKVYANINASSRHHLEDLEESLRFGANGNKLGKEADALIDKLTKAITKEYPDIKKAPAGVNRLLEVLDKNRKELYGKIGIHILTRYSRKYNFMEPGLPYMEELEILEALLDQMPNGQAWLKEYEQEVAKYLRPGWVQHFMNPGAKENVDYVAPIAVKPSESIAVEAKGAQARVKQEVKVAQKAKEELKVEPEAVKIEAKPVVAEAKPAAVEAKPAVVEAKPAAKEVVKKKLGIVVSPVVKALPPDQLAAPMMPEPMAEDVLSIDEPVRGVALTTPVKIAAKEAPAPVSPEAPKDTNMTYSILQPDQYDAVARIQKVILGASPSEEETVYLFSRLMGAPLSGVLRWLANRELPENKLDDIESEVGDIMGDTGDQDARTEQEEEIASETESLSVDNKMEDELSARDVIRILFDYRFKARRGYREFKKLMDFYQSHVLKRMAALQKGEAPKSYALMVEDEATFDAWVTGKAVSDSEILLQNIAAEMGYEAFKSQMVLHLSRPVLLALRLVVEKDSEGREVLRTASENGLDLLLDFRQSAIKKILGEENKLFERWSNMAAGLTARVSGDPKDAGFKTLAAHISQWAKKAADIKTPPKGAQERYTSARVAGASDYDMGALASTLGISYFADWLSGIQAKYWEIARKNPKTASRPDNEAIRGLYKTIKVITESMSEEKRDLLKSVNLSRVEQQQLFNQWMQKIESDVFNGVFVTGDVTYGIKSNVEKLALQQQSYRNPGADLDTQHETPGGRRATALRAYGPAVQQFEIAQINAVDDGSEDCKRLKTAQIVVLSGVENKLTDRGKDAQDMSTDDIDGSVDGKSKGYLERINVAEFIPEGKFFIRIQTGDKQQLVGIIADKFYNTDSHEMNYKAARKWVDTITMGAASSWDNNPVKEGVRGGSFASRGLMWTPSTADGGIGAHMRVVVLNDPDKDFDGEILMTDAGYKGARVSAPMGAAATTFKTLIAGVMNGMPLLFKGLFAPMLISKQLGGFRVGISERVEAYNAKHPDKPIHAVVSSQTAKQWAYKVHDFGATEFEPSEIPLHMAFAQANLDTAHDLHYIKTPIQLPADLQSTPAGPKLLEYLYEMQKEALDNMSDMPPMIDMVRTEMQDVLALLGREDADAYKRAVEADDKATVDAIKARMATREQSPYITAIRDRLRSSKVVKTAIRAYGMRGFHGIALSAAGSDKVFDSDKVDEGYVGAIVSVNVTKDPSNPNNVRYATWYDNTNEDEVAADVARQIREDGQGFGADLVKRNADGSFIAPLDKVKPEHLRRHEFRQVGKRIMAPGSWVIINRTPGTGLESHILARLGDDPGEAAGNTVYLAKSVVLRAGVDFDGDKWAVFPLPLKNGRVDENAFETRFINAMVSAYDSLTLEQLHNAIDVNAMQKKDKTFADDVKKLLAVIKAKGMLDPSAWSMVDHMNWDSKKALGVLVSSLSMVQFGVTAGGLRLKVPVYPDSNEPSWNMRLMKDFYLTRLGDIDLDEWRASDGFMRALTGTLTNMIVDNPKQPQVDALGINNLTAGMAVTALLFSEPAHNKDEADALVKKVTTWLKQPVVKHFVTILRKSRSVDSYSYLKYQELKAALEAALSADTKLSKKALYDQSEMIDGVIQVGRYIANEFFALSRVVKIGQYPVADAAAFDKLRKDFDSVDANGFRNFDTMALKDSATMKKAHVVMAALQQRVYNDGHLMHTPLFKDMLELAEEGPTYLDVKESQRSAVRGAQPKIVTTEEKPKDAPMIKPEDVWKRMEVVRLVTAATQPDVGSDSYRVEMSDPRVLGLHLVPIIQELQDAMPDNEFVTSLMARKYPIGVDIKYQGVNLNTNVAMEQIAALQDAAEKIQPTNGWSRDQILRGLAVYAAWAYGASLSSRSGNYVVALPTRINDIIAQQTQALTQAALSEAQRTEAERYIQGMYHAMGYRRYDVNWGVSVPKAEIDYSATGAGFKYEGRTEYKGVAVKVFYSKESSVDVVYKQGVININTAKAPKNNAAVEALVEAAYQRSQEGKAPAPVVAPVVAPAPKAPVTPGPQEPVDTSIFGAEMHARTKAAELAKKSLAATEAWTKARAGISANTPKGRQKKFDYETKVLLTDAEQTEEKLSQISSRIKAPAAPAKTGIGLSKGPAKGEVDEAMRLYENLPRHHITRVFSNTGAGFSIDQVAKEAGFEGNISGFVDQLISESAMRTERMNEEGALVARAGIYFNDRESAEQWLRDEQASGNTFSLAFVNSMETNPAFRARYENAYVHHTSLSDDEFVKTFEAAKKVNLVKRKASLFKPGGFWFSVGSSWNDWEKYDWPDRLQTEISDWEFKPDTKLNILKLSTEDAILDFTKTYGRTTEHGIQDIDWQAVANKYDGVVIAPYQWNLRLDPRTQWYYAWDVAAGVVWNLKDSTVERISVPITQEPVAPADTYSVMAPKEEYPEYDFYPGLEILGTVKNETDIALFSHRGGLVTHKSAGLLGGNRWRFQDSNPDTILWWEPATREEQNRVADKLMSEFPDIAKPPFTHIVIGAKTTADRQRFAYSVLAPKERETLINDVLDLMAHFNNKPNRNLLAPGDRDNYARRIAMALRGDVAAMEFINDHTKAERKTSAKAKAVMDKLWRYHKAAVNRVLDIDARRQDLGDNDPDREEPRPDIQYSITNVAKINGDMLKGLIGLGNLGLHNILMKETFAVEAMNYIEGMRYENLRVLYGRNGVARDAKGKKVADMSADDLRMVRQFFWTVTALVEDPVIRKLLDAGATAAVLEAAAIKRGLIAYSNPIFNDIGKGKQVLFEQLPAGIKYIYFKYKGNIYKRITTKSADFTTGEERVYVSYWNQSNNTKVDAKIFEKETIELPDAQPMETYASFKARWTASQAYKNLIKAGRTEAELDWTLRAREDAKFYKDARKLAPYIKNRANYVLHIWGSGFPTLESQQAQDKLTTALQHVIDESAGATWLPESAYQMEFKTPEKPAVLTEQRALYQQLTGVEVDLAGLTMWDMNVMLARELRARQYEIAVEMGNAYNPIEAGNAKDLATIKRLEATTRGYKFKEWTARSMPRTLHGTYADIYSDETQRRHITLPDGRKVSAPFRAKNMDAMDLRIQYMRDITASNMNRNLIHQYLLTPDYDGTPLVIAIPSAYVDEHPLIPDALYREMGQRWAKSVGKAINPNENIRGQLEALARDYGSDYEVQESPYPSVARFLVKKGDDTSALMKHVIQAHTKWMVGDHDMLEWLAFVTQLSKVSSVGWSLFFMMTNIETLIAGTGAKTNVLTNIPKAWNDIRKVMKELLAADPSLAMMVAEMLEGRIDVSTTTAAGEARSAVDRAFARLHENVRLLWGEDAARRVSIGADVIFGRYFTNIFFGKPGENAGLFPAFKIYTAKLWADTEAKRRNYDGIGDPRISKQERVEIYKSISGFINSALGASAPQLYTMQTPKYQQFSGLTLFAYKWTEAALQIFGAEKIFGALYGATMTKRSNELVALNAAMMVSLVLIGFPSLLQSIIWATAGGPEDHPFPIQNEAGRKTYVDITPWARMMPGYKGDPTGRRREYMRWGKQFYEVADGWLTEPYSQLMRKLSQPAKVVVEQITGRSPGSDWNLDFQGQGLKGWLLAERDDEISFINSRLGMVVQKFIPMSVLGGMKNPETAIAGALAPLSKGMSMGRATAELIIVFNTAAHEGNWKQYRKFPDARANLEGLGADILDAAARNGYDTAKIISTAKGVVLSRLYKGFTAAMNNGDAATMDKISKQILRVGGTIKGLQKSIMQRKLMTGQPKELPAEELDAIETAFGAPGALEPKKK